MKQYFVKKPKKIKSITIKQSQIPGSKSMTNRAFILAALSQKCCCLLNAAQCDDTDAMLDCLVRLGFKISDIKKHHKRSIWIQGTGGSIPHRQATLNVRSSGTTARFLTAMLAVCGGEYTLESSEQMKRRPMKEFLDLLIRLGVGIHYLEKEGFFPYRIKSFGIADVDISIDTTVSTQFASAMLLVSKAKNINVHLTGSRTQGAYIYMTKKMLEVSDGIFRIEPDVSAACYFYAMALLLRTKVRVTNIFSNSLQGDLQFLTVIKQLGGKIRETKSGLVVDCRNVIEYPGIDIDMHDFSDQALTMAVIAAFATSETKIRNIGHISRQESDRVMVMKTELQKTGCNVLIEKTEKCTDVLIQPGTLHGAEVTTYEDHRVAMSFALMGLVIDGIIINDPLCCKKTFANYFHLLDWITGK